MSDEVVELIVSTTRWYSHGDNDNFYRWLESIDGFIECKGLGYSLYIKFRSHKLDRASIVEIVGLFSRYYVADMKQLSVFGRGPEGEWFCNKDKYWHATIFDSACGNVQDD